VPAQYCWQDDELIKKQSRYSPRTHAQSEDGHTPFHRMYQYGSPVVSARPSASVAFLPTITTPRSARAASDIGHGMPRSAFVSQETISTSASHELASPATQGAPMSSFKRQVRKLTKPRPHREISSPAVAPNASRSSIFFPRPTVLPAPQPRPASSIPRTSSMANLTKRHPGPSNEYIVRPRSENGHGSRPSPRPELAPPYRSRPLPTTPPAFLPSIQLTTEQRSLAPSVPHLTIPSPTLEALSNATIDSDSTAIAARLSRDLSYDFGPVPVEPMISGKNWVIGEEDDSAFDPYTLVVAPHLEVPTSVDGFRKRQRSPNSSQGSHGVRASRSPSRSRGVSPGPKSKSRSRSRSITRTGAHGEVPTDTSFVRTRGAKEVNLMRRWALAMADSCYDGAVLAEFDALQRQSSRGSTRPRKRRSLSLERGKDDNFDAQRRTMDAVYGGPPVSDTIAITEEITQATRRALLSCRDLVRAEKSYQAVLLQLLYGKVRSLLHLRPLPAADDMTQTKTSAPPLMLTYVPALVNASEELLAALAEDPSAWGLAKALMRLQPVLEAAFVPWCGAVAQWFIDNEAPPALLRREKKAPGSGPATPVASVAERRKSRGKAVSRGSLDGTSVPSLSRRGLSSITPFVNNAPAAPGRNTSTLALDESDSPFRERIDSFEMVNQGRTLTVRDLAIQPTQRVMRYVLHYRGMLAPILLHDIGVLIMSPSDILKHTPEGSATYVVLTEALKAASSLAEKCDRAQGNAAFLLARTS
jgi:hypothetical protein